MKRNLVPAIKVGESKLYEHCIYGKQDKRVFKAEENTIMGILHYIHSDVWSSLITIKN